MSSKVAEKMLCWWDGRRVRASRAQKLRNCVEWFSAAGDGIQLRFYTLVTCRFEATTILTAALLNPLANVWRYHTLLRFEKLESSSNQ